MVESDLATATARRLISEHLGSLEADAGADETAATVRAVSVHYLDEHWVQHLSKLQSIRDGIHLQALAGHRPADEFHRIALHEFQGFFEAVYNDAAQFLQTLTATEITRDLHELGLRRPSATWTYMVTDDPYGTAGDRLAKELGRGWRSKILKIE
jgi:preprotein translocase subunit SecA